MKNIGNLPVHIESGGSAVKIAHTASMLAVRTRGDADQFVLSPVLFRGQWTRPAEVTVRDRESRRRYVLRQAQPQMQQRATVLLNAKRYFVTSVTADELASKDDTEQAHAKER